MYTRKTNPFAIRKRNLEILEKRLAGRTLEDISQDYGITRERVRQVVNDTLNRLPDDERARAEGLFAVNLGGGIERHLLVRRQGIARALRALFGTEFNREKILKIIGMDHFKGTDLDLCAFLYGKYQIKNFFRWRRCWGCKEIKPLRRNGPAICTQCNTIRHKETLSRNPHLVGRQKESQKAKPKHMQLYQLRSRLRREGRLKEMPPLPPHGTPDFKVAIPEILDRRFGNRSSIEGRRDNKAKRLVIEEARSRGIDAEL